MEDVCGALDLVNYGLALLYGVFLSTGMAGGWETKGQKIMIFALCPVSLLIQGVCWQLLGLEATRKLYPLIVHLPLALVLIFGLKKHWAVAAVSVCTGYLCCHLPRCASTVVTVATGSELAGEIVYTVLIAPVFLLLWHYFIRHAYNAMTYSNWSLALFGSLPVFYYIFDYATAIYSNIIYRGNRALAEMLPTILILFYVGFLTAYRAQLQKRVQAELHGSLLETELKQAEEEMTVLRQSETQAALYQHDMRHHLNAISGFLSTGQTEQAAAYIQNAKMEIEAITPKRFCENEMVNLLCSSFAGKAQRAGVRLLVDAKLPKVLDISDTELCSVLSNGLENALHAVTPLEAARKWVELSCWTRFNKLLIEIKNPCEGGIVMQEGIPVSQRPGHGYGCRSMQAIARRRGGICEFKEEKGLFQLQVMLPMNGGPAQG